MTAILYLAPARTSGHNVCPLASVGCKASCLNTAGRGQMGSVQLGRINKTKWYFLERDSFLNQLRIEIKRHILRCKKKGFKPAIRLNGTSDIDWNIHGLFIEFSIAPATSSSFLSLISIKLQLFSSETL